jgi:putative thioredoxin
MVVWQGQVIPGFTGALPEAQVRDFLNQVIALAGDEPPVAGETEPEIDPALDAADQAMQQNDLAGAAAAYEQLLRDRPGDVDALRGLAQVDLLRRTEGHDLASVLAKVSADPTDVSSQLLAADLELLAGDVQAAFDRLLALLGGLVDGESKEQAKTHLLALLDLVGNDDPRVLAARRSLASTLF